MGWNGSSETGGGQAAPRGARRNVPPSKWHGLAALLIVVAAGGLAAWLFMGGNDKTKEARDGMRPSQIAEVKPQIPTNQVAEAKDAPAKERDAEIRQRREMLKKMTPDERADYNWERLKEKPLDLNVPSNRVFATGTEQIMSWIFRTELGSLPPPLPAIPPHEMAHFTEILIADNPIGENDDEQRADAKETVVLVKKELMEYIKNGGEPAEFFEYYRGQLTQAFEQREQYRKSAMDIIRNDPEIAGEYIGKINAELAEKGIKKITFNPKMLDRFGVQIDEDSTPKDKQGETK